MLVRIVKRYGPKKMGLECRANLPEEPIVDFLKTTFHRQKNAMAAATFWQTLAWTRFSRPACDQALYRRIQRTPPTRVVEFGVGDLGRTQRVISLAQRFLADDDPEARVQYCGMDLFEMRTDQTPLKLKSAHNTLARTGAKIRLVPGDLRSALARTANILTETDLLIVDAAHDREELESVFNFLPRMLHSNTSIARYDTQGGKLRLRWMKPDSFVTPVRRRRAA